MSQDLCSRRLCWLALSRVKNAVGSGAARVFSGRNLEAVFASPGADPAWTPLLEEARQHLPRAREELSRAEGVGARLIDVEDTEYPGSLRALADPPLALFVLGSLLPCDARAVAVVGTRASTRYGAEMTRRIVAPLAAHEVTIVSGMAMGIDSHAHRAALTAGGRTIAVLGTGIDVPYPDCSRDLYRSIPKQGAVVSESPPGMPAAKWVFKPRNRIVSGLAKAVVVVEARLHSGTRNTTAHAFDQGRDVYAVPGDADLARSDGTNAILADGAYPARSAADILFGTFKELYRDPDVRDVARPVTLAPPLAEVLALLGPEPMAVDAILARAKMSVARLLAALSGLERAGVAQRDANGRYARFGKSSPSG